MGAHDRLVAEELLLLAWDDDAGRPHRALATALGPAIGGALLVDLALAGGLHVEVDAPRARARATGDALLDAVASELRAGPRRRRLRRWIRRIGTTARRVQVRDRLVTGGALRPEDRSASGSPRRPRYHLTDPAGCDQRADEVRQVLIDGRGADPPLTALAALVGASPLRDQLVPYGARRDARRRAERLADAPALTAATRATLRASQAVLRTTTATAAASTTPGTTLRR